MEHNDRVSFLFDKENDKAIITKNSEQREVNLVEGFQEALKIGDSDEIHKFANENNMSEEFRTAESKNFTEGIREQNEENKETKITLTDKETGESRELGATEAFQEALKNVNDDEKKEMQEWAKSNGLEKEFSAAEAINSAVQSFSDNFADSIIENNKNSENAFDRGVGEFLESLDNKAGKVDEGAER